MSQADKTVRNIATLKAMEKDGHIVLHSHTGETITTPYGAKIKAYYIDEGVNGKRSFVYKNQTYFIEYCSGSFFPYVVAK